MKASAGVDVSSRSCNTFVIGVLIGVLFGADVLDGVNVENAWARAGGYRGLKKSIPSKANFPFISPPF